MYQVRTTEEFDRWIDGLRDRRAQSVIARRLLRVEAGLLGDWKSVGDGVCELRIDFGPGYRLYYALRGKVVVILLTGSAKDDQSRAINKAKALALKI